MPFPSGYQLLSGEQLNKAINEAVALAVSQAAPLTLPANDPYVAGQLYYQLGAAPMVGQPQPLVFHISAGPPPTAVSILGALTYGADYSGPLAIITMTQAVTLDDIEVSANVTGYANITTSVSGANGTFVVTGTVPSAQFNLSFPLEIWFQQANTFVPGSVSGTLAIPLEIAGPDSGVSSIGSLTYGEDYSGPLATFTFTDPTVELNDLTLTTTPSLSTSVSGADGSFVVSGTIPADLLTTASVLISLSDDAGYSASVTVPLGVSAPPSTVVGVPSVGALVYGTDYVGPLATFTFTPDTVALDWVTYLAPACTDLSIAGSAGVFVVTGTIPAAALDLSGMILFPGSASIAVTVTAPSVAAVSIPAGPGALTTEQPLVLVLYDPSWTNDGAIATAAINETSFFAVPLGFYLAADPSFVPVITIDWGDGNTNTTTDGTPALSLNGNVITGSYNYFTDDPNFYGLATLTMSANDPSGNPVTVSATQTFNVINC